MDVIAYSVMAFGMLIVAAGFFSVLVSAAARMSAWYNRARKRRDRAACRTQPIYAGPDSQIGRDLAEMKFSFSPDDQAVAQEARKNDVPIRSSELLHGEVIPPDNPDIISAQRATRAEGVKQVSPSEETVMMSGSVEKSVDDAPSSRMCSTSRVETLGLTREERELILQIQEMLGLAKEGVVLSAPQIAMVQVCNRMLARSGPEQAFPSLNHDAEENPFFSGSADLMELPPGGGNREEYPLEFDLGAFRGLNTPSPLGRRIVVGSVIVTSSCIQFSSPNREARMAIDHITGFDLFSDMIRILAIGTTKSMTLKVENPPALAIALTQAFSFANEY
ncbi:MAG: hypothetical protein WA705_02055 [Candidatus Ozemobacteraceae bacterium]